ncbi:hypothetical protein V22_21450 [Calycomorphotria hydatis]|uniref:Uncharacterized protein n=1 Tax=Calycomorphotria hydatis TaxID=2528027 RepID=A0A517T938_9PLAN|nr:hypothetical protein V22_21450 [Calycomorphotria hydatis]
MKGRTHARESKPVKPAPDEDVNASLPLTPAVVRLLGHPNRQTGLNNRLPLRNQHLRFTQMLIDLLRRNSLSRLIYFPLLIGFLSQPM